MEVVILTVSASAKTQNLHRTFHTLTRCIKSKPKAGARKLDVSVHWRKVSQLPCSKALNISLVLQT